MKKPDYRSMKPTGKCPVCGINCWETNSNKPTVWPCGISTCPYPQGHAKIIPFPRSMTGSAIAQITYDGS